MAAGLPQTGMTTISARRAVIAGASSGTRRERGHTRTQKQQPQHWDSALHGVLTGCGKQKIGAAVNLGAFYLAGIPMVPGGAACVCLPSERNATSPKLDFSPAKT
ncbi:hypothetical protein C2845_PM07G09260 [Panicum miliaceum]|uniref:Uncharacterized protein n=1 Tax=Panicum miliaceum TaxID=4540 RepID=A0A3L6SS26_PANMI|nr:hypothetical protein C2845_PM07G09260 [Panicum miliaceum]